MRGIWRLLKTLCVMAFLDRESTFGRYYQIEEEESS